jgi:membrane protease YdiL (CAAX protease family)
MEPFERKHLRLLIEFLLVFVLLPPAMLAIPFRVPKIPLLLGAALICGWRLWRSPLFDRSWFRPPEPLMPFLRKVALKAVVTAILLGIGVAVFTPERLFIFPLQQTGLWLLVIIFYPFLSALPQELIYRAFFFHRYRDLFRGEHRMVWANVMAFAFLHIIFGNPVAPLLTVPGGYLFARTYLRTRSLPAAVIEHAAYGDIVFTVGLGGYFFRGW